MQSSVKCQVQEPGIFETYLELEYGPIVGSLFFSLYQSLSLYMYAQDIKYW